MKAVTRFWAHDENCCGRDVFVGARYRRQRKDLFTGELGSWETYRVIECEPIRHDRLFCRRVHIQCERTGKVFRPFVANFWGAGYEAIENVVSLRKEPNS